MKRFCAILLVICLVFAFTACGGKDADSNKEVGSGEYPYNYDYDLSPYVTLGETDGLTYIPRAFVLQEGDTAGIDFVGTKDGVAFEGGTGSNDLVIGSGSFIPGFEEGLIGHAPGETVVLDLTFPEGYGNAELAGQPVQFTVTINDMNGYATEAELAEALIWDAYFQRCEIKDYPQKEVDTMVQQQLDYYTQYVELSGGTMDDFYAAYDITEEDFKSELTADSQNTVAQDMVMYALARQEGLVPSDADYEAAKQNLFEKYGVTTDKEFEDTYGLSVDDPQLVGSITSSATLDLVLSFLAEKATPAEQY